MIGTILLTWHFRTQHLDFMVPRGVELSPEDYGENLAVGPIALQPVIEENPEVTEVLGNPEEPEEDIVAEITDLELGDLEASPGLDTYRSFAESNDPDRLFELSSTLRARGQFQRALLAFERIIDTSKAESTTLDEAAKGIETLAPTLPSWNVDPTTEISLILHLGTAKGASDNLKSALLQVATLIRASSSDLLEITPKISTNRSNTAVEDSPISIWISTNEKDSPTTPVISLSPSADQDQAIDGISLAVFKTVRSQLNALGYPSPPSFQASGKDLLTTYITRLMWRDFAKSLYKKADPETEGDASPN